MFCFVRIHLFEPNSKQMKRLPQKYKVKFDNCANKSALFLQTIISCSAGCIAFEAQNCPAYNNCSPLIICSHSASQLARNANGKQSNYIPCITLNQNVICAVFGIFCSLCHWRRKWFTVSLISAHLFAKCGFIYRNITLFSRLSPIYFKFLYNVSSSGCLPCILLTT